MNINGNQRLAYNPPLNFFNDKDAIESDIKQKLIDRLTEELTIFEDSWRRTGNLNSANTVLFIKTWIKDF